MVKPVESEDTMTKKVEEFKKHVEDLAKFNHGDFDAVEYEDDFNCNEYNDAVEKINEFEEENGFAAYDLLFTEEEMLNLNVMYACINCGAIESDMTKVLNDNWREFAMWYER